jgi:hypothetical protein
MYEYNFLQTDNLKNVSNMYKNSIFVNKRVMMAITHEDDFLLRDEGE